VANGSLGLLSPPGCPGKGQNVGAGLTDQDLCILRPVRIRTPKSVFVITVEFGTYCLNKTVADFCDSRSDSHLSSTGLSSHQREVGHIERQVHSQAGSNLTNMLNFFPFYDPYCIRILRFTTRLGSYLN